MADTKIAISLDPQDVIQSLKRISQEAKSVSDSLQNDLGKNASSSINDLKNNAENGTNQITKFFSNMGTRIREDLKTAFDLSSVIAGANFAKQIGEGVKSVFDMERAFDRLGVRLKLTGSQMDDFKRSAGQAVSSAGVDLKDVNPGLMEAAGRGGVRSPEQLTMIARSLAESRQIDPTLDTGAMTDNIAEILQRQGLKMDGTNFGATMDAINAATANGGFHNSGDAATQIAKLAQYSTTNGMGTRQIAGLATVASQGGDASRSLLNQILAAGGDVDHGARINSLFGQQVFKDGKLDPEALGRVNTKQFGSDAVFGAATGLGGANGGDLKMLIDTFKNNMGSFKTVVDGTNETADEFGKATQSWAAQTELFKKRLTNTGREIGDSLVETITGLYRGDSGKAASGLNHGMQSLKDNAGDLAIGGALTVGAGLLMGGGLRGLIGSATASAAGEQKVYVTNASEISGPMSGGLASLGTALPVGIAAAIGAGLGYAAVQGLDAVTGGGYSKTAGKPGEWLADKIGDSGALESQIKQDKKNLDRYNSNHPSAQMNAHDYYNMVYKGIVDGSKAADASKRPQLINNKSAVTGRQ